MDIKDRLKNLFNFNSIEQQIEQPIIVPDENSLNLNSEDHKENKGCAPEKLDYDAIENEIFNNNVSVNKIINEIVNLYGPTDSGVTATNGNGSTFVKNFNNEFSLFNIVRYGDLDNFKNAFYYYKNNIDINKTDALGNSLLHIAMLYGHYDIAFFLLENGANPNQKGYKGLTSWNSYFNNLLAGLYSSDLDLDKALELFQELLKHSVEPGMGTKSPSGSINYIPYSAMLEAMAPEAKTIEHYNKIMDFVEKYNMHDNASQTYMDAKILLNVIPVPKFSEYNLKFNNQGEERLFSIKAGGFFTHQSVPFIQKSLSNYLTEITSNDKLEAFENIVQFFTKSAEYAQHYGDKSFTEKAYQDYLSGQTVFLPSGWKNHFVGILVNKALNIFISSNCGDRAEALKPGALIYIMHNPEALTEDAFYKILNNSDQTELESDFHYMLGLEPIFRIIESEQTYGNCTIENQKPAIEAALMFHLMEKAISTSQEIDYHTINTTAHKWMTDFVHDLELKTINNYFENNPLLEIRAFGNMLETKCKTMFNQKGRENTPINDHEYEIADALIKGISEHYRADIPKIIHVFKQATPELIDICDRHHLFENTLDINDVLSNPSSSGIDGIADPHDASFVDNSTAGDTSSHEQFSFWSALEELHQILHPQLDLLET